ncbi:MAG: carbohydrate ABC transporter permease, partial [Oscillospiraceae bacterium]
MSNSTEKINGGKMLAARIVSYVFLAFVTVLSLFSFYLLIINATRSNAQLQAGFTLLPKEHFIDNLVKAWNDTALFSIPRGLLNSFIVAACSSILTTYFSAMTAYGIHVYDFKGKKAVFTF